MEYHVYQKDVATKPPFIDLQVIDPAKDKIGSGWTKIGEFEHDGVHADADYAPGHAMYNHIKYIMIGEGVLGMQHVRIMPDAKTPPATITFTQTASVAVGASINHPVTFTPADTDDWANFYITATGSDKATAVMEFDKGRLVVTGVGAGTATFRVRHRTVAAIDRTLTVTVTAA